VAGSWRRLHNEELHNLCALSNIIRVIKSVRMKLVGHVVRIGEIRSIYKILFGKSEEKRPLGRPKCKWEISEFYVCVRPGRFLCGL
jgi:hypothetical protein